MKNKAYYEAYFQKQKGYYVDHLERLEAGKHLSFNLGAFVFSFFWLIYRKMYNHAVAYLGIMFVGSALMGLLFSSWDAEAQNAIMILATLAIQITLGFWGNKLYFKQARKHVTTLVAVAKEESVRLALIKAKGGVAYSAYIIFALWVAALIFAQRFLGA